MSGHAKKDKLWNDYIQENIRVALIKKKMTEDRLRWFGHVQRRPTEAPMWKVNQMIFNPVRRGRERPKRTLGEIIRGDLGINSIPKNLIWDQE